MKFGKRRQDADAAQADVSVADSATPPVAESWTAAGAAQPPAEAVAEDEPVVEGEAVELPPAEPAAPQYEPAAAHGSAAAPGPMPFPVAEQPVGVVESASRPGLGAAPVTSLGDSGEAFASGHAAAPGPNWQEPLMELADERPELVVAAAFAGGILAAMILRRLGT